MLLLNATDMAFAMDSSVSPAILAMLDSIAPFVRPIIR